MSFPQIGRGFVCHARAEGARNQFWYPHFFLTFPLTAEASVRKTLVKKFAFFLSLSNQAYLQGSNECLDLAAKEFLRQNCNYEADEIWLQTLPRMFGYAFNPVNFWLCRRAGQLEAVLVEVNNTFGERHFYWLRPHEGICPASWHRAKKVFHVSPFFPVDGYYQFRFQVGETSSRIDINYHADDGKLRLATWVSGDLSPLESQSFIGLLTAYGWITPLVVLRIHFQALRLWIKRTPFHTKPPTPKNEVSS